MLIFVASFKKYGGSEADALTLECWIVIASFWQCNSIVAIKDYFTLLHNEIWIFTWKSNKNS